LERKLQEVPRNHVSTVSKGLKEAAILRHLDETLHSLHSAFDVKVLNIQAILAVAGNNDYARPHHRDYLSA
jgi:hypothetical protein